MKECNANERKWSECNEWRDKLSNVMNTQISSLFGSVKEDLDEAFNEIEIV